MSEIPEENSYQKSHNSSSIKLSAAKVQENEEEEILEDKYNLQINLESNRLSNKLITLLQECLLSPVNKFNSDIFRKYDKENLLDKDDIDQIELDINNFKLSFIEEQFKIIKELIAKYNLIDGLKNLSEEKTFSEELKKLNVNSDILSFIGPLSNKINEINEINKEQGENKDESNDVEKFLFKILEMGYYNRKTALLEESIKLMDSQIEELKNKNKIFN